jgi:hypothetical protein
LQILLQDIYNIGVLTVNIEIRWLGTKRMERLAKVRLFPVSVQLILKSYLPVVYGTPLMIKIKDNGTPIDTSIVIPVRGVA